MNEERDELFPNEAEATKLLSNGGTLLKGIELVLGRAVQADELKTDEVLQNIVHTSLDGETRYALLLMKKDLDPKEQTKNQSS